MISDDLQAMVYMLLRQAMKEGVAVMGFLTPSNPKPGPMQDKAGTLMTFQNTSEDASEVAEKFHGIADYIVEREAEGRVAHILVPKVN